MPDDRSRSDSPRRLEEEAARKGIDRYVPGGGGGTRSRSPMPRRGRRPGARREQGHSQDNRGDNRGGTRGRPRKTQEELDAEMADYFNGGQGTEQAATNGNVPPPADDDLDMIE